MKINFKNKMRIDSGPILSQVPSKLLHLTFVRCVFKIWFGFHTPYMTVYFPFPYHP